MKPLKLRTTRRGVRMMHARHVVSEALHRPGATHSVFDVLAALTVLLSPEPELTLLGFAAGGMIAPLRALGHDHRVHGVDLDLQGARLFSRVASAWKGQVTVTRSDAVAFLHSLNRCSPCIVEDLSVQTPDGDVQKPGVSFGDLPALIESRLSDRGVAVFNLLPSSQRSWAAIERCVRAPFVEARRVDLAGYENRIVVAGRRLPSARVLVSQCNGLLSALGSRMTGTLKAKTL